MRRVDRLFDIIQILRGARRPVPASAIAARLEVAVRTVYRDVAVLQGSGVPIEGASGLGYVLGDGFTLPPLMFTPEEMQTVAVALDLIRRTGDRGLQEAAEQVRGKIASVLPPNLRERGTAPFFVSPQGAQVPSIVCMSELRGAMQTARKLRIEYADGSGRTTARVIWPLAIAYYMEATLIGAWCELRGQYRHFRTDRIRALSILPDLYPADQPGLLSGWRALHEGWIASDGAPALSDAPGY